MPSVHEQDVLAVTAIARVNLTPRAAAPKPKKNLR